MDATEDEQGAPDAAESASDEGAPLAGAPQRLEPERVDRGQQGVFGLH